MLDQTGTDGVSAPGLPRFVTMARFTEMYGISRSLAYEMIAAGKISSIKIGRRRLIEIASMERHIVSLIELGDKAITMAREAEKS